MPLSSLLERFRRGTSGAAPAARAPSPSDVEALRTRARRRLIGMVVLVGAGVLGFPWLFETQPRPMSPDVRIVQAGQHAHDLDASPRAASGRVAQAPHRDRDAQVVNITPPAASVESPTARGDSAAEPASQDRAPPRPLEPKADVREPVRQADKPQAKPADKPAEKAADKKPDPKAADTRYVVQFGAFADVKAARETRQKAERMGLKTYAQQVDTPQGKRIRVRLGPFADKAEAERALATLRKGGLNGNILTL